MWSGLTTGSRCPNTSQSSLPALCLRARMIWAYFAAEMGVTPVFVPEMSREISAKDALTIWKLYRLFLREQPDIVHTHTAKAGTVGRLAGLLYRWLTPGLLARAPAALPFRPHVPRPHLSQLLRPAQDAAVSFIEKTLARLATDRIVVISQQQRREIHEQFGVGRRASVCSRSARPRPETFCGWQERGRELSRRAWVEAGRCSGGNRRAADRSQEP